MASPVTIRLGKKSLERFESFESEILLDDSFFHLSELGPREYHNAYDADENFSLIRIDLIFKTGSSEFELPAFAKKEQSGSWKWVCRFRPTTSGDWTCRPRVLVWHPTAAKKEPKGSQRKSASGVTYYEHAFGLVEADYKKNPTVEQRFTVKEAKRSGPLETADVTENRNYFYRVIERNGEYKRQPFFLIGICRPWVVDDRAWGSDLDRDKELLSPMAMSGCNVLYHWMAPWETQLVHQSKAEHWPQANGSFLELPSLPVSGNPGAVGGQLRGSDLSLGYKRFDQGRATRTDQIFDLAEQRQILLFFSVMQHSSLRDSSHPWGNSFWTGSSSAAEPSKYNGFRVFKGPQGGPVSIEEFFKADPNGAAGNWSRRLFKHWANYWRYVIARWTAHPALGAWILLDEMEGLGKKDSWFWDNKDFTYPWHDRLLELIRGQLRWKWEGKDLAYTGDYLLHPLSSSATQYQFPGSGASNGTKDSELMQRLASVREIPDHGTWNGHKRGLNFLSHHAYQYVPCRGVWTGTGKSRRYQVIPGQGTLKWETSNTESAPERIPADRWLWDSLCTRLAAWSRENAGNTRLITEYGCLERKRPYPQEKWDEYGKRVPGFTHFANWAGLSLGMAGTPFKWNDGQKFGEMASRTLRGQPNTAWSSTAYPPNSYAEMKNLANFVKGLDFSKLVHQPKGGWVIDARGKLLPELSVFALFADTVEILIAWLYDRTFESKGQTLRRSLILDVTVLDRAYSYEFFDTWAGQPLKGATGSLKTDDKGHLTIALPRFPKHAKDPEGTVKGIADGNDIAILLKETK